MKKRGAVPLRRTTGSLSACPEHRRRGVPQIRSSSISLIERAPEGWSKEFSGALLSEADMEDRTTKGESREGKRRKRRRMRVVGRSVKALQDIIMRKARDARKPEEENRP